MNVQRRLALALKPVMVDNIFFEMNFGKHKGKTVGEVFEIEPSYLVWAHETCGHFTLSEDMYGQALEAKQLAYQKHWYVQCLEKGLSIDDAHDAFVKKFKYEPSDDFIHAAIYGMDHLSATFKSHVHTNGSEGSVTAAPDEQIPPWDENQLEKLDKVMGQLDAAYDPSKLAHHLTEQVKMIKFAMMFDKPPEDPDKPEDKENDCPF